MTDSQEPQPASQIPPDVVQLQADIRSDPIIMPVGYLLPYSIFRLRGSKEHFVYHGAQPYTTLKVGSATACSPKSRSDFDVPFSFDTLVEVVSVPLGFKTVPTRKSGFYDAEKNTIQCPHCKTHLDDSCLCLEEKQIVTYSVELESDPDILIRIYSDGETSYGQAWLFCGKCYAEFDLPYGMEYGWH